MIPPIPSGDRIRKKENNTHPPSQRELQDYSDNHKEQSYTDITSETKQFLLDLIKHPLSTTVLRYQRLHHSRRKGNAIRQQLLDAQTIEPVPLPTRSGQVMLYQLTDQGRALCEHYRIAPGAKPPESLEHRYWMQQAAATYEKQGYEVTREYQVKGNGAIDLVAEKSGEQIAIEVETGKSDIPENLKNALEADMDSIVLVATSATAVTACQKAIDDCTLREKESIKLMTWLDMT